MSISGKLKPSVAFVKAVYNVWYYNINGIKDEVVKLLDDSKVISLFCFGEIHDYYSFCKNDFPIIFHDKKIYLDIRLKSIFS